MALIITTGVTIRDDGDDQNRVHDVRINMVATSVS